MTKFKSIFSLLYTLSFICKPYSKLKYEFDSFLKKKINE